MEWNIKDMHSLNGTYINDTKLDPTAYYSLELGDKLGFGVSTVDYENHPEYYQDPEMFVYRFIYACPFFNSERYQLLSAQNIRA
jgi:hypothetical protein